MRFLAHGVTARKRGSVLLVVFALVAVAASCSDDDTVGAAPTGAGSDGSTVATDGSTVASDDSTPASDGSTVASEGSTTSAIAADGGDLRVVMVSEPRSLNPLIQGRHYVSIVEQFMRIDDAGEPTDRSLIESYEQIDSTTWRFSLRDGVEFSNGEPLNAEAAVYAIGVARDDDGTVFGRAEFAIVNEATAVDNLTFEATTTQPTLVLPRMFEILWALPPAYYAQVGAEEFGKSPIGTGPMKLDSWDAGTRIRTTRNESYWRGSPHIDAVTFTFAPDPSTRSGLLVSGDADVILNVPGTERSNLEGTAGVAVLRYDSFLSMHVMFYKEVGPLADDLLREAAALAIDKDQLIDAVLGGVGEGARPTTSYLGSPFDIGTDELDPDVERARSLVEQAGGDPQVTVNFTTGGYVGDAELGEAVSGMLENVGFRVTRNPLDPAEFRPAMREHRLDGVVLQPISPPYPDPIAVAVVSFSSTGTVLSCLDADVDAMIAQALVETDTAKRQDLFHDIEHRVIHELHCFVPLFDYIDAVGYAAAVHGLDVPRDAMIDYAAVSLSK